MESGCLGGKRELRDTRIHFDHSHATVVRIDSELNIRAASFTPTLRMMRMAASRISWYSCRQRLNRGHSDGIAGVNTIGSRFSILQMMTTLSLIAHHLELKFLPPITDSSIRISCVGLRSNHAAPALQIPPS
jgi:hypothetical protein